MKLTGRLARHVLLIATATLLVSCASNQAKYRAKSQAQENQLSQWIPEARTLVEQHRGVNLSGVAVSSAAGRGLLYVLHEMNRQRSDQDIPAYLSDQAFRSHALSTMHSALAIYDPYFKRIVINQPVFQHFLDSMQSRGISKRKAAMTVLIHEMVHAADDIEYDLTAMTKRHRGDKLGARMVSEGHAELQTESICVKGDCLEAFYTAHKLYARELLNHTQGSTPTFNSSSAFVYMQGLRFLKSLERKDPTGELVKLALKNPPGDALEFFDAANFPDRVRADRRARLYDILETVELTMPGQATGVPEQIFDLFALPQDRIGRDNYIQQQRERILASASMKYYYQLDQNRFTSVKIDLYETASAGTAKALAEQLIDTNHHQHMRGSKILGISSSTLNESELGEISTGLPSETRRIVRDIGQGENPDSMRFFTSLLTEGPYLIKVDNSNNNELNKQVIVEMLEALRQQSLVADNSDSV